MTGDIGTVIAGAGVGAIAGFLLILAAAVVTGAAIASALGRRGARGQAPEPPVDDALTVICGPCHGEPRRSDRTARCTCTSDCGADGCVGDHTTVTGDWSGALRALLDGEGDGRG